MRNKIILLSLVSMFFSIDSALSQETIYYPDNKPPSQPAKVPFKDRIFISPDLGLQFGTVTLIMLAPKVGYRITEKFAAGLGASYVYVKDKSYPGYTFESNTYGGSIFAQYQLFESIRAYSEYEVLNLEIYDPYLNNTRRENIPSLLVGGGYSQQIGGNSGFFIMALYNLLDGPNSIYSNPVIRIGFNVGF